MLAKLIDERVLEYDVVESRMRPSNSVYSQSHAKWLLTVEISNISPLEITIVDHQQSDASQF
jgi:hypothetical protein